LNKYEEILKMVQNVQAISETKLLNILEKAGQSNVAKLTTYFALKNKLNDFKYFVKVVDKLNISFMKVIYNNLIAILSADKEFAEIISYIKSIS
jgi:hypothetical protein